MPMTKTGRPALAAAAATYDGIGPPPAMIVSASPSGIIIAAGACHTTARSAERAIPAGAGPLADRRGKGDDVGGNAGEPADEGMRTDPAMLLNRGEPAENRVLAHLAVTAQRGIVDHQNMVGDDAVMGDMGTDHQEAFVADHGAPAAACSAPLHRRIFADDAVAADGYRG